MNSKTLRVVLFSLVVFLVVVSVARAYEQRGSIPILVADGGMACSSGLQSGVTYSVQSRDAAGFHYRAVNQGTSAVDQDDPYIAQNALFDIPMKDVNSICVVGDDGGTATVRVYKVVQ